MDSATSSNPTFVGIIRNRRRIGKTITAANLAHQLHRLGAHTLMVDMDPQAGLTNLLMYKVLHTRSLVDIREAGWDAYLTVSNDDAYPSMFNVLVDRSMRLDEVVLRIQRGLFLAPNSFRSVYDTWSLRVDPVGGLRLRDALAYVQDYNYVVLDPSSESDVWQANVVLAADWVLIPVASQTFSDWSLEEFLEDILNLRALVHLDSSHIAMYRTQAEAPPITSSEAQALSHQIGARLHTISAKYRVALLETTINWKHGLIYPGFTGTGARRWLHDDYQHLVAEMLKLWQVTE